MGRGRKVNSSGERSMKLLREKAIEIFSEHGYFQTKISDIVKAASVTQPTFYLYFESKEALYKDIILDFQTNIEKIIDDTVFEFEHQKNIKFTLQAVLTRVFDYFDENPHLTKIGLYESNAPFVSEILPEKFKYILEKNPHFTNDVKLEIFIQSLMGSIERLTLSLLLSNNISSAALAEDVVKIYFAKEEAIVAV